MSAAFTIPRRTTARIQRDIAFHLERADDLERFASPWWRLSKYAWLAAANVHRHAARDLQLILADLA